MSVPTPNIGRYISASILESEPAAIARMRSAALTSAPSRQRATKTNSGRRMENHTSHVSDHSGLMVLDTPKMSVRSCAIEYRG
jgi:hypothetical protein